MSTIGRAPSWQLLRAVADYFHQSFCASIPLCGTFVTKRLFKVGGSSNWREGRWRQTKGGMEQCTNSTTEKDKKFAEICALLARELGLGEFAKLGVEDRHQIDLAADQHLKEWDETTEFRTRANIRPITPLRRLLSQHQQICERILDEEEIEVGLWAQKRGSRRQRQLAKQL